MPKFGCLGLRQMKLCVPVPMTSTVCSTACCLRISATRLHCLMSWCTYGMPNALKELLARLGDACAQPDTEDGDLVLLASRPGAMVETVGDLKAWLTGQLHCWVGQQHLRNYQGVVGSSLMDLALPITICLLDYFLPQLAPTEHCVDTLDVMAAPIRCSRKPMTFTLLQEDVDFVCYAFTNQSRGLISVIRPTTAYCAGGSACSNRIAIIRPTCTGLLS